MPLVRFPLRNEYGLGKPELYKEADKECPKAVLDGVAVAGLVGILRQLGDLAEFAAEVFHGLQEQVMNTASRSHRLKDRVKNIEAALPSLEKAVLRQTSHIHFAYTAGCEWHPRFKNERNHFISNDLPEFIMDSYEECRDPPNLHLLDKFDMGGPGSCLRRYSDPTFFKKISEEKCVEAIPVKAQRNRKARKKKKKGSFQSNQELLHHEPTYSGSGRMKINSVVNEQASPSDTASTIDNTIKSDPGEFLNSVYSRQRYFQMNGEVLHKPVGNGSQRMLFDSEVCGKTSPSHTSSTVDTITKSDPLDDSHSFGFRTGAGYIECVFHPSVSIQTAGKSTKSSSLLEQNGDHNSVPSVVNDKLPYVSPEKKISSSPSSVTLDEKEEILDNTVRQIDIADCPLAFTAKENLNTVEETAVYANDTKDTCAVSDDESILKSGIDLCQANEIDSEPENFMDALNTIESESENDSDCQIKQVEHLFSKFNRSGIIERANNMKNLELPNLGSHTAHDIPSSTSEDQELSDSVYEYPPDMAEQCSPKCGPFTVSHDNLNEEIPNSLPENHATVIAAHTQVPDITENSVSDSVHEFPPDTPEQHSPTVDPFAVSHDNLNEEIPNTLPDKYAVETTAHKQLPYTIENSVSDCVVDADSSCNTVKINGSNFDSQNTETTCSGSNVSNLLDKSGDGVSTFTNESNEFPVSFSNGNQVSFWTNGGLLGLQPSKPPTFSIPSSACQGSSIQMKREMLDAQNRNAAVSYEHKAKFDVLAENVQFGKEDTNYGCSSSHYTQDDQISDKRASSLSSAADAFSSLDYQQNSFLQVNGENLDEIKMTAPGTALPVAPNMKANSLETNFTSDTDQGVSVNSSVVFGLGHRLLMNGLYGKVIGNDKPETATTGGICESNQNGLQGIANQHSPKSTANEKFVETSIIESPTLSPPLEHMKISFQPISRLEASKLQLKFPDVNHSHASARDLFPSFKLVPEPGISLHGPGSYSDEDDTFCRSSPYGSDDCLSQNSGCDSDQWECIETEKQRIHDHVEYRSSHRITSTESSPSSPELKGSSSPGIDAGHNVYKDNRLGTSPNGPLLNFPSFDTMDSLLMQESEENLISKNFKPERNAETGPVPPPLPPMQWCTSKSLSDVTESKSNKFSEDIDLVNDRRLVEQIFAQEHRLTLTTKKQNHEEELAHAVKERLDRQMLNGQIEANHVHNNRTMDVKEDFLHQIRTRSFNLRRTVPTKSNVTTGPVANVNVTAILEKASAIRQAVASDDGEDEDNWSDT